jgi:predicted transcriptional regulator
MSALLAAIAAEGADALAIAGSLGLDPLLVMRRLAAVPELAVGLVTCDASGTLTFRKPAAGFPLPRFGAACPLWPLYSALGQPRQPVEALVESAGAGGRRFRVQAWCETRRPGGPKGPELREAAMLVLPDGQAQGRALVVGSSCRICPQSDCPARREPTILSEAG